MSSILRLTIENFQSHCKTVLEPASDGLLTVVVGPSDTGKTAIIRALRWLLYNVPQGDDFIRVGCTLCRVTLELQSGHKIIRERTKGGVNRYKILAPEADKPETYEGFGHVVPLEVRELTGVQPVTIGDLTLNLNMSEQLEGPFLGSAVSGGARARILGKLAGTEEVDHAAKLLGTDLYRVKQDEKRLSADLTELEEKIADYDYLVDMAARIESLECYCSTAKVDQEKCAQLNGLKAQLDVVDVKIAEAQRGIDRWLNIEAAQDSMQKAGRNTEKSSRLSTFRQSLKAANVQTDYAVAAIDRLESLPVAHMAVDMAETEIYQLRTLRISKRKCEVLEYTIQTLADAIEKLSGVPKAEELLNTSAQATVRLNTLNQQKVAIRQFYLIINHYQGMVSKYGQLEAASECANAAASMNENHFKLTKLSAILSDYNNRSNAKQNKVVVLENQITEFEGAYRDALLTEGRCPTCGNDIKPEKLKEVV